MKSSALKRKSAMKRSQPRRDWMEARAKVAREGGCRFGVCSEAKVEAAHIIGREHDREFTLTQRSALLGDPPFRAAPWPVEPVRIVPLCTTHHRAYDAHELDILHILTLEEQLQAVQDAGGIENARRRLAPSLYRRES